MKPSDFPAFCRLMTDVYQRAFGEPLDRLPHGKAQHLSWLVYETTGAQLSYKTLSQYVHAVLHGDACLVNPNDSTLSILVAFLEGRTVRCSPFLAWYRYRQERV
jgi:hypothetical protein